MGAILKLFFVLAPLVGQGIIQVQNQLGVTHSTVAGTVAGWLIAAALSGRAIVSDSSKNVSK